MANYEKKGVADANMAGLQSFTATGRPYKATDLGGGLTAGAMGDTFAAGSGPANLLPVKFTDNSILTIPVLPNGRIEVVSDSASQMTNDVKEEKSKGFFRKMSSSKASGKKKGSSDFIMKEMTRGHYLKYYAKDENGRFCGSEEPADDCILNDADIKKYQKPLAFTNDIKKM